MVDMQDIKLAELMASEMVRLKVESKDFDVVSEKACKMVLWKALEMVVLKGLMQELLWADGMAFQMAFQME